MARSATKSAGLKTEDAYNFIRKRIETGHYPGGSRLTLQTLSDEVGVSLTPVREALRMLQANGLVDYVPHHGHVVTRYSLARAEEIYVLRTTLEPLATELAATRATKGELGAIKRLDDKYQTVVAAGNTGKIVDLNSQWHRAVYSAGHSTYLDEFIDRLWSGVPYQAIWFVNRADRSAVDHHAITVALLDGDGASAAKLMREHILRGREATIQHLQAIGAPAD